MAGNSCPDCFSNKITEIRESVPIKMETPDGLKQFSLVKSVKCHRCGWKGQKEELVSLRKFSARKMGKIRSRMKRRR